MQGKTNEHAVPQKVGFEYRILYAQARDVDQYVTGGFIVIMQLCEHNFLLPWITD